MGAAECKGCIGADPTSDTVKISPTLLAEANTKPAEQLRQEQEAAELVRRAREEQEAAERKEAEEAARQQREAEERLAQERAEAEARERAEAEREQAEREAAEKAAAAEEARQAEASAAAEAAQVATQQEEARRTAELEQAKKKVADFCKAKGFKSAVAPKTGCMKVQYPIHQAVQDKNAEVVAALLKCGADRSSKNGSGKTPLELAKKLDKKGSHAAVIAALSA